MGRPVAALADPGGDKKWDASPPAIIITCVYCTESHFEDFFLQKSMHCWQFKVEIAKNALIFAKQFKSFSHGKIYGTSIHRWICLAALILKFVKTSIPSPEICVFNLSLFLTICLACPRVRPSLSSISEEWQVFLNLGMCRLLISKIQPEPDFARFTSRNMAGAGAWFGRKITTLR